MRCCGVEEEEHHDCLLSVLLAALALRCARSSVVRENCAALLRGLVFVFEYHSVGHSSI